MLKIMTLNILEDILFLRLMNYSPMKKILRNLFIPLKGFHIGEDNINLNEMITVVYTNKKLLTNSEALSASTEFYWPS